MSRCNLSAECEFGADSNAPVHLLQMGHECSDVIMSLFNVNSSSIACILTFRSSVLHHSDLLYCRSVACWASALFVMLIVDMSDLCGGDLLLPSYVFGSGL